MFKVVFASVSLSSLIVLLRVFPMEKCKIKNKFPKNFESETSQNRIYILEKVVYNKKGVLKNSTKFTGKHLCWSLFLVKFWVLRNFKNTVFIEHHRATVFGIL